MSFITNIEEFKNNFDRSCVEYSINIHIDQLMAKKVERKGLHPNVVKNLHLQCSNRDIQHMLDVAAMTAVTPSYDRDGKPVPVAERFSKNSRLNFQDWCDEIKTLIDQYEETTFEEMSLEELRKSLGASTGAVPDSGDMKIYTSELKHEINREKATFDRKYKHAMEALHLMDNYYLIKLGELKLRFMKVRHQTDLEFAKALSLI